MNREAMKLALKALEWNMCYLPSYGSDTAMAINAMTALREALAEQPAQQEQEPICKLFGTLPVYDRAAQRKPAQHEPFTHYRHYDNGLQDWADEKTIPLYTSPLAQRPWVGLTDEDKKTPDMGKYVFLNDDWIDGYKTGLEKAEAKLKEKNA